MTALLAAQRKSQEKRSIPLQIKFANSVNIAPHG